MAFVPGMKVRYAPQPEWGVGHLVRTLEGGAIAEVLFPGRAQPTLVSTRGHAPLAQAGEEAGVGNRSQHLRLGQLVLRAILVAEEVAP